MALRFSSDLVGMEADQLRRYPKPMPKVVSVNVGIPRQVVSAAKRVTTGIFKSPVSGRITVQKLNLQGDAQADLSVHGGPSKAVYAYPSEHYAYWRTELPAMELPWGVFGENLTVEGLLEDGVHLGEMFRVGTAVLKVTQPRIPCYKLGIRFGRDDMVGRFLSSRRCGFYFAVVEEGEVGAGDVVETIAREQNSITIATLLRLYLDPASSQPGEIQRAVQSDSLTPGWKRRLLNARD